MCMTHAAIYGCYSTSLVNMVNNSSFILLGSDTLTCTKLRSFCFEEGIKQHDKNQAEAAGQAKSKKYCRILFDLLHVIHFCM